MNRDTAQIALGFYNELSMLDGKLRAMKTTPTYAKTPLQKVTFYMGSSTYSGPTDYEPMHKEKAIATLIIADMETERRSICAKIKSIGFDAPNFTMD